MKFLVVVTPPSIYQHTKREKADDIGPIAKASIAPIYTEEVRKTDPMVILREKGRCILSRRILIRASEYDTVRSCIVLPIHQIKTVER